jgi:hypothetical protein
MAVNVPTPPPPPRLTGDPNIDLVAIANWANDFYKAAVVSGYFLNTQDQSESGGFDPNSLPDPATSTVAQAQQTANEAYAKAVAAQEDADAAAAQTNKWHSGTVTVSGASTTGIVTFAADKKQPDAVYLVLLTPVSFVGTPGIGAFVQIGTSALATTGFTVTVQAAPGVGNSVTFNYLIVRAL